MAKLFLLALVAAVAVNGVAAQGNVTDELRTFANLNLWQEVNSTANTIWQTCFQQQTRLNASAAAIGANCTINGACTTFNCTARDGQTRLAVASNVCVPSLTRRITGNPALAAEVGNFTLTSYDPITAWRPAELNLATRTGFYNVSGTQGNTTINSIIYIPAQFCSPNNRAFRVGASWRVNVDDRITPDMNWTQVIDMQIRNAVNVSGACTDITTPPLGTTSASYAQFTCNVPYANGSTPVAGVNGSITAWFQPCQREYAVTIAGQRFWFSPSARVNYTVPGTQTPRANATLLRGQGARVSGATQNWTSTNPPVPRGPQGNVPQFQLTNSPNVIKWTFNLFYNTSNVTFQTAAVYGPRDACQWMGGVSSNAVAGIVTGGILFLGLIFVILFAIFGRFL